MKYTCRGNYFCMCGILTQYSSVPSSSPSPMSGRAFSSLRPHSTRPHLQIDKKKAKNPMEPHFHRCDCVTLSLTHPLSFPLSLTLSFSLTLTHTLTHYTLSSLNTHELSFVVTSSVSLSSPVVPSPASSSPGRGLLPLTWRLLPWPSLSLL